MAREESEHAKAERLVRLFTSQEPPEIRAYLTVLQGNAAYHAGSTVPVIGEVHQLANGLWVPANVQLAPAPIDLMKTYITFNEVFSRPVDLAALRGMLGHYGRDDVLGTCGTLLRAMAEGGIGAWEQNLVRVLQPPYKNHLATALEEGRPLFSRQSLYVIAKLALVDCAQSSDGQALPLEVKIGIFSLLVHEVLGSRRRPEQEVAGATRIGGLPSRLSMEIIANHWFNRSMDEANYLALFERRWISGTRQSTQRVASRFQDALGFGVDEMSAIALALWAGSRDDGRPVVFDLSWLDPLRLPQGRLEAVLSLIATDPETAAAQITAHELKPGELDWNFDTFERYPLLRLDERRVLVLDPALLVRRCLGWAPIYDLATAKGGIDNAAAHALADASEAYAMDVLQSMYAGGPVQRLYDEVEVQAAYGTDRRNADALVDYGTSALIVEITARRPIRGFLHGGPEAQFIAQIEIIKEEAAQIAATAHAFNADPGRLLGVGEGKPRRLYPVLVMTEGFPTNPITLSAIRNSIAEADMFNGLDAAPIEVIDLVELEMLESVAEAGGPDIPTLLDAKATSNFHADSVRNYLTTRTDLDLKRSTRIGSLLSRPLDRIARALQGGELEQPGGPDAPV